MTTRRYDREFRDVTDSPSDWSADDVEICQTNFSHPSITSGQHTNGPAMIWIEWQQKHGVSFEAMYRAYGKLRLELRMKGVEV